MSRSRRWATVVCAAVVMLFFAFSAQDARAQTPTDEVVECILESMDSYSECLDSGGLVNDILCSLKYDADFYLCFFEVL